MRKPPAYHIRRDALIKRLKHVLDLHNSGLTHRQIGFKIGVGKERVRQLIPQAKQEFSVTKKWDSGVSGKLRQIFWVVGIENKDQAMDSYLIGDLSTVKKIRNYGWETRRELAAWLGLSDPTARPSDMAKEWKRNKYGF